MASVARLRPHQSSTFIHQEWAGIFNFASYGTGQLAMIREELALCGSEES